MKGNMMRTMWGKAMAAGGALLLAGGIAGCSNENVPDAPIENSAFDEEAAPPAEPNAEASFEPAPVIADNAAAMAPPAEELPPPPPVAPDQQVLDDASATGMTSRTTRDQPQQDDTAPVEGGVSNQSGE